MKTDSESTSSTLPPKTSLPTSTPPFQKTLTLDSRPVEKNFSSRMHVQKRDGSLEMVDVGKIVKAVEKCTDGLDDVDPLRVATQAISGLYHGAKTEELDLLCIQTASLLMSDEPQYSKLAARLLSEFIAEEVELIPAKNFTQSIQHGLQTGLISPPVADFVSQNQDALESLLDHSKDQLFEYFGLKVLYDRYLLKDPKTRKVFERPQYFFLRVSCGLTQNIDEVKELYELISSLDYMPSSPTLFNSGTRHSQLSSCYLVNSPQDTLESIYKKYLDVALLSKFAGGIGLSFHQVRSRGSHIQGTNGVSNGIIPFLKTLDSSVSAVNQGGRRKGAACVYLETWHADIEDFLELRDNTGDEARRTHHLNLANWVPDLFMKRVESDGPWSLFDPKDVPELTHLYGENFETKYLQFEKQGIYKKQIQARKLYARMMKTLAETGNGWMTFKDNCNLKCNQTSDQKHVVHLSNLCTEIIEVTSESETAVCNLGSINLSHHLRGKFTPGSQISFEFDFEKLGQSVKTATKFLDRVIDINFYPIPQASHSNSLWRPVGLGVMGLQDVFFKLKIPFDSPEAQKLSKKIQEEIYFHALQTSCELAKENGPHLNYKKTRAFEGSLQFNLWESKFKESSRWKKLKSEIKKYGLRNSLLIAIAPTATIAAIVGSYESIEPQVSNLFKRETLSGEFLQINRYLIKTLKSLGLWNQEMKTLLKNHEGSIQNIPSIPDSIKKLYRTAWEIPMKSLIDMASERGPFIDQSQSLNLFMESPTIGKLSSMYFYAWKKGLKTTYYLRSRPATKIKKTLGDPQKVTSEQAVSCSLENPESCEACQ